MSKTNTPPADVQELSLTEAKEAVQQISPAVLQKFLHTAQQNCYAFELRIKAAQAANDTAGIKQLNDDPEYARFKKRRDYFTKELAAKFPAFKVTPPDLKAVERQIVVNDYLGALQAKRDAHINAQAAKALEDETERKMAVQDMQRALKYIAYLEPKYKKFEKALTRTR